MYVCIYVEIMCFPCIDTYTYMYRYTCKSYIEKNIYVFGSSWKYYGDAAVQFHLKDLKSGSVAIVALISPFVGVATGYRQRAQSRTGFAKVQAAEPL